MISLPIIAARRQFQGTEHHRQFYDMFLVEKSDENETMSYRCEEVRYIADVKHQPKLPFLNDTQERGKWIVMGTAEQLKKVQEALEWKFV